MKRFISLTGGNSETTILNGENLNKIISSSFSGNDFSIQGISIINGNAEDGSYYEEGGGIYCGSSDLLISDVVIENNQAEKGGGLYFVGGDLMLLNVSVKNNNALNNNSGYGGGIYCSTYSCANFNNVLVTGNYASGNGGGIFCESWSEDAVFSNTVIKENSSDNNGGGIYFNSVNPELSSVSVTQNHGEFGGGIYFDNSEPNFDSENRCSIYSNTTSSAYSKDICLSNWNDEITVIVDTFTVYNPTDIHAYPIENFTFDIQNAVNGLIDADIYVNPTGSDYNSGLTPEDPLRTINYALCLIISNEEDPNNIYLSEGTYGLPNINGYSPLPGKSYVNIVGENPETTIIDGGNNCEIFFLEDIQNFTLQNALLTQGEPEVIYAAFSDFTLKNVIISGNTENARNIYCLHSDALLENVLMHNNITTHSGVYALSSSHLKIINSTFANNETTESGGMIGITNSDAEVINTICWNNSPNNFNLYHDSGTLTVAYSAIANGEDDVDLNGGSSTVNWLEGNIVIDPIFENPEIFNFLLQQDSPCIDTGTAFLEWNDEVLVDLSEDEYYGTAPDMGAFEYGMSSFDDNNINSPVKFSLSQNYPNPFNPITTISFSVSSKDTEGAKLEIYNIKGQKIITFCHPELVEGSVIWNGNDEAGNAVSSGVYFYKLRSGKKSAIKKMLLMK